MTTTNIIITTIQSADSKSKTYLQSELSTNKLKASIEVSYGGSKLTFPTATEFQTFLTQVLYPTANKLASSSGSGISYVPLIPPVAGIDTIVD